MTPFVAPPPSDPRRARYCKYPLGIGSANVVVTTDDEDHVRDLILQLLFTSPGERINLPEFGAGVRDLLFEPGGGALALTAQFVISSAIERWLGDRVQLTSVAVASEPGDEATVTIALEYLLIATRAPQSLTVRL